MAKILFCISNSIPVNKGYKIACFYEQIISELQKYGNDVLVFDPNLFNTSPFCSENVLKNEISETSLREKISKFSPDLVITFNNATYSRILEVTDCPIVVWNADMPYLWNQTDLIKNNKERYTFFSFSDRVIKQIQDFFGFRDSQCHYVNCATSLQPENIPQTSNISFIGSCFITDPVFFPLITRHCGKEKLIRLMRKIHQNPFCSKESLFEDINGDSELSRDFSEIPASYYPNFYSAQNRIQTLLNIADLGLSLYGTKEWLELMKWLPDIAAAFNPQAVYSVKHTQDIYNGSRIAININHCQATTGMAWRVPEIMATNACIVSSDNQFISDSFKKYLKIPTFGNSFEAYDLCQKLLKDNQWRREIVTASQQAIDAEWRWHHRFRQMEDILGMSLFSSTPGSAETMCPVRIRLENNNAIPHILNRIYPNKISLKIKYKIWKHLDKRLRKKGLIK